MDKKSSATVPDKAVRKAWPDTVAVLVNAMLFDTLVTPIGIIMNSFGMRIRGALRRVGFLHKSHM